PIYEQARVLADVLTDANPNASYGGSRLATTLKVMGVDLVSMGEGASPGSHCEVLTHTDPAEGVFKKLVLHRGRLVGAMLPGAPDPLGRLSRLSKEGQPLTTPATDLLAEGSARDALLGQGDGAGMKDLPDETQICNCHSVSKGQIVAAIAEGNCSMGKVGD